MAMVQHVTRETPPDRLEACLAFYGQLGFTEVPTPAGIGDRAVWLQLGSTQIHLMPGEQARPQAGHVGVVVEDYERRVEQLTAAGFRVDPRQEHWGSPRAYVRDPAGNLVEVMAFAPPPAT